MGDPDIHIIGAGPVGLATALLLAAQDRRVTIHEARDVISLADANSYPIGVNPRGQETLRRIDPRLVEELRAQGELVEGFKIRAGRRMLASLRSGVIIGTTRARLTGILLAAVEQDRRITLSTGHRLEAIDLASRTLQFTGPSTVEVGNGLVIACDGVWSKTRQSMAEQRADFAPDVSDWGVQFRVLFSAPGAVAPGLDPNWHHIFTGKGIYTATLPDGVWCVAVTAIKGDPAEALLLSREPTEDHINALRRHLRQYAPLVLPLLTRDAYVDFFGRAPFGGAVVRCPRVSHDEWLVLLGDAAHSVIPPTGEGVNSGLEDAMLLADALASGSSMPLREYDEGRVPDLKALGEYACHLKDNVANEDPVRSVSNVGLRILSAVAGLVGQKAGELESRLFGPDAGRMPYRDAIGPWIQFRDRWTPPLRRIATGVMRRVNKPISTEPQTLVAHQREGARRRICVIGGSSGTGRELAELALKRGFEVTCLSRRGAGPVGARLVSGEGIDLRFELLHPFLKLPFGLFERLCVETHPVLLHSCQHGHEWHFDVVKHTLHLVRSHLGFEERFEGEGDVGIFAGVVDDGLWFDVGHVFLRASRPNELVDVDGAVVEVDFGKVVKVVALFGLHHIVGEHCIEKWCAHLHPIMREHREVVFEILPHFQNFVIFKNRT